MSSGLVEALMCHIYTHRLPSNSPSSEQRGFTHERPFPPRGKSGQEKVDMLQITLVIGSIRIHVLTSFILRRGVCMCVCVCVCVCMGVCFLDCYVRGEHCRQDFSEDLDIRWRQQTSIFMVPPSQVALIITDFCPLPSVSPA